MAGIRHGSSGVGERKWTEAGIPLTTQLLGWVVSASTLVTCCRKWSTQNWPLYQTTPSPNTRMVAIRTNLILALRKMHPDIVGDEHQQEREQERDAPAPVVERGLAEIGACCDDDEERQYDSEDGRGLQPASVVPGLGDYASSCGSWSVYSATGNIPMALSEAIIATYMTIHMARSPVSHSERIASPCQEFREGAEILRV